MEERGGRRERLFRGGVRRVMEAGGLNGNLDVRHAQPAIGKDTNGAIRTNVQNATE